MNPRRRLLSIRYRRRQALFLGLIGLGLLPALGCSRTAAKPAAADGAAASAIPKVPTATVQRQVVKRTIDLPGSVEAYETADLYAKVGGYLKEIRADIGDQVKGPPRDEDGKISEPNKGDVLARLWVPEMKKLVAQKEAQLEQAKAEYKQAEAAKRQAQADADSAQALVDQAETEKAEQQANLFYRQRAFERIKQLVEAKSTVPERLDEARFQLDMARAAVQTAEAKIRTASANLAAAKAKKAKADADARSALARVKVAEAALDYTRTLADYALITAPFDGVIVKRWLHSGAFVQPAEGNSAARPIFTIARTDRVRIVVALPMTEAHWLDADDRAVVRSQALPGKQLAAHVARFAAAFHEKSRMMRVELEPDQHDSRLRPGTYVYVHLTLAEHDNVPVIPPSALRTDAEGKFVFVVRDGSCRRQPVETLYEDGEKIAIASGLQGGEEIVTATSSPLQDGQKVLTAR